MVAGSWAPARSSWPFPVCAALDRGLGASQHRAQSEALPQTQAELRGAKPGAGQTVSDGLH